MATERFRNNSIASILTDQGQGSRLQLLQSVLTSMPIYFLCTLAIPPGLIKQIERIQRQCLWRGNSDASRQSLAAWDLVCLPKNKGGLEVFNLKVQNEALLLKDLHKFYNHLDVPWVRLIWDSYFDEQVPHATTICGSFWWRDIFKLADKYCQIARPVPGQGTSILFWTDRWELDRSSRPLCERFPWLFYFVIDGLCSIQQALDHDLVSGFHLPLSNEAYVEMQGLLTLGSSGQKHITLMFMLILLQTQFSTGYGSVLAHSRLRCLVGCCSWTD